MNLDILDEAELMSSESGLILAAAQFSVALMCLAVNQREIRHEYGSERMPEPWRLFSIALMLLAINSLLHGDTALPNWMREIARQDNVYEWRRIVQFVLLVAFIPMAWKGFERLKLSVLKFPALSQLKRALNGLTLLLLVLVLRVISFHYTDDFVDMEIAGVGLGRWLEWMGISMIAYAAGFRLLTPNFS